MRITLTMETLWIGRTVHAWKPVLKIRKAAVGRQQLMAPQCSLGATAILLSPQLSYIALIFGRCVLLGWFQTRHADTRMGHNASISYFVSVTQNPLMQNHRYRGRKRKNSRWSKSTDLIKLALITLTCTNQCTYSLPHAYCATQMNYTSCSIEPTMLQHNSWEELYSSCSEECEKCSKH